MSSIQNSSTELVEVRHTQASTSSAFIGGFWTNIFVECSYQIFAIGSSKPGSSGSALTASGLSRICGGKLGR